MGSKKGLLSKSPYMIWQGRIEGERYEAKAHCSLCGIRLGNCEAEEAEVPPLDLPDWALLMIEDHGFIEDADSPATLATLDVITNVPASDVEEVTDLLLATTGCPLGHDLTRIVWRKL